MSKKSLPSDYFSLLEDLKTEIRNARFRASISANTELLTIYWQIGKGILKQQGNGNGVLKS